MPAANRIPAPALLALALLLAVAVPVRAQSDDPRRAYLAGNGFLARKMDALAVEEYRTFLDANPDHEEAPTARYGLGVALGRLGKNEEAIAALDGLERLEGFRFANESRIVAASAEAALGRHAEAAKHLAPLIDHAAQPTIEAAAALLIESLHRADEDEEAVRAADRIIGRFSVETLGPRGALFAALSAERSGDDAKATAWARAVAGRGGDETLDSPAQLCIARARLRAGDFDEAIRIGERCVQHGPDDSRAEAMNILARALRGAGRIDEADRMYARLQNESLGSSGNGDILIQRGVIACEEGRYEQALRLLTQGDDGSETVARWAARCERRLGKPGDAADRLAKLAEPSPGALYELGVALQDSDRLEEASSAFERFLLASASDPAPESDDLRAHAVYALASIDYASTRYRRCAQRCRAILGDAAATDAAIRPGVRLLLAESLYLDGDLESAKLAFKDCLDNDPAGESRSSIAYRLGMIHARLGDTAAAETILRSVTRGDSTDSEFAPALRTLGDLAMGREDWAAAISAYTSFQSITDGADDATMMKLGIALARSDQHRQALEAFDAAIDGTLDRGQLARAHFERGDARRALGDSDGAGEDWRRSMQLDDDGAIRTAAGLRLSNMALAGGDPRAAMRQLRAVIDTTQDATARATATLDLARVQLQSGDSAGAASTLGGLALNDLPDNRSGEALACRSIALARSGDDRGAADADARIEALGAAVDPQLLAPLLYERAWRLRRSADPRAAIETYERLLDLNPEGSIAAGAVLELSDLLLETGDTDAAVARLRAVLGSDSLDETTAADASIRLGTLEYNRADDAAAVDALQRVLDRSDPDDRSMDRARLLCGESLRRLGLWASAVSRFEVAARSDDPSIAEPAMLRLGSCAAEIQRWSVSESAFAQHLDRFPSSEHRLASLFGIGWARESSGDPESAIGAYRQAAQGQTETAARAQFQLGECLFALGRHKEAAGELIKVDILYASPAWSAAALYEAGRCFDAMGDGEQAAEQWRRVADADGAGEWAAMARARLGSNPRPAIAGNNDPDSTD